MTYSLKAKFENIHLLIHLKQHFQIYNYNRTYSLKTKFENLHLQCDLFT